MSPTSEIQSFITSFEERLAPVERAVGEAWWSLATTGADEAQQSVIRTGIAYNDLFADPGEAVKVQSWYEQLAGIESTLLSRQVEVLHRMFAAHTGDRATLDRIQELEAAANAVYNNHRGAVQGREVGENEIREILTSSPDPALRREAWEAS
ncbi:MAG: hypothetical protein WKF44_03485, partial [Rubrobacteraceae bacterium]